MTKKYVVEVNTNERIIFTAVRCTNCGRFIDADFAKYAGKMKPYCDNCYAFLTDKQKKLKTKRLISRKFKKLLESL